MTLADAIMRDGYAVAELSDDAQHLYREILAAGRSFFRRPRWEKEHDSIGEQFQGYRPFGGEYSVSPDRPDLHESFWVTGLDGQQRCARFSVCGKELYYLLSRYAEQVIHLERELTVALMDFFGNRGEPSFECTSLSDVQCLYYRPAAERRALLQDAHEDAMYLTITKADEPGLEVRNRGGLYRPLKVDEGQVVIMPGEIMTVMTGGLVPPLYHRVRRFRRLAERLVVGYFLVPARVGSRPLEPWIDKGAGSEADLEELIRYNQAKYLSPPSVAFNSS